MIIRKLILLFILAFLIPQEVYAFRSPPKVDVYNLSNTPYSEKFFTIHKDIVYWLDSSNGIIYGYDFSKQKNSPLFENQPVLPNLYSIVAYDGRYLVYNIYDNVSYNINVYDIKKDKVIAITEGSGSRIATDYEERILVYIDGGACGKLYTYNIVTSERKLISEEVCGTANISERFIVWSYAVSSGAGIFGYDLRKDKKYDIATGPIYRSSPDISNKKVIWAVNNNNPQIYIYDLRTNKESLLYKGSNYTVSWPSISKRYAVWGKNTTQHVSGVEGIDLRTGQIFEIQEQGPHQNDNLSAIIDDNIVAWMAWRTGNGDIYGAEIKH